MDPATQGAIGAAFAQTRGSTKTLAKAAVIGAMAGMAPDLDVLIRSTTDPLFALEFHRHFTHSLLFIPFGALLCALVFYGLLAKRWQLGFTQIYVWSLIGYATHGLLDGCTTYGTQLLWPLTNHRFAWDLISVVDLAFTLPILAMVWLCAWQKQRGYLLAGIAWGACYLTIGFIQHERAVQMGADIAAERGHQVLRIGAKPSFSNLVVWKIVYETPDYFYVDAVKPGITNNRVWQGDRVKKVELERDLPWLDRGSQQARDIQRFDWFSSGYIAIDPNDPYRIVDVRYSLLPNEIKPLWGISLSPQADAKTHASYYTQRDNPRESLQQLINMILE
ncbi:MAG: metal-dependent hydrolase [Candidatus Pelagadaptatus aseana]|uniref:metal-dependent hydrolase n=1 Tax=Candidatus Pelagadaptatus aseana TaxID=3120508 RepID=UPI0039B16193